MMRRRSCAYVTGGLLAGLVLLAATEGSTAVPTSCSTADFVVNATMATTGGQTRYTYSMSSPTGKSVNKFFVYVDQGLQGDLAGTLGGLPAGSYVPNGSPGPSGCLPGDAWVFDRDDDGYCFTSVTTAQQPTLTVSERSQPEEGASTVILGTPLGYQVCGPIAGPTSPTAQFEDSSLETTTIFRTFNNGCMYILELNPRTGVPSSMRVDPAGPTNATVPPNEACVVTLAEGICEADTGLVSCQILGGFDPPLQSVPGGICYYPKNIRFTC